MPAFTALSYRFYGTRLTSYLKLRKKLSTPTLSDVVPNPTVGLQAARVSSAGKTCRRQDSGNNRKIVSNVHPFLPKLTMNGQFIRDFIAAESPCFALGLVEERKQQCGFLALRPDEVIPPEISAVGFNFGHALLGTAEFEVIQFAFQFYGFETYNVLVNPNNHLVKRVLITDGGKCH